MERKGAEEGGRERGSTGTPPLAAGLAIDFTIAAYGWMECSFTVEGRATPFTVTASYVSDVVGAFVGLAQSIAMGVTNADALVLHREPGGSVLTCLVRGDVAEVAIDSSDDAGSLAFRVTVPQLVRAIADGVDRIDRRQYRDEWGQFDFPEERLRALREVMTITGMA